MKDLILLHGAIGAKDQLEPLAEKLQNNYNVHLLNFSGHGGQAFNGDFSIPLFAEEVMAYMTRHKIQKASFFGYSMGGYVAMYLANRHPGSVDKVITLGTKYYWDEAVAAKEVKMLDPEVIEQKVPAFAEQLKQRHSPNDWKKVLSMTSEMLVQMGKQPPLQLKEYSTISQPCLILLGDKDKMVSLEETKAVHEALPSAEFKLLPDTSHPIEGVNLSSLESKFSYFLLS